jgi:hypothetical protein
METIRGLQKDVHLLLEEDELKWRQRAKVLWLKEGDQNSKYFHAFVSQRKRANLVTQIADMGGHVRSTPEGVQQAFLEYFNNIFTSTIPADSTGLLQGLFERVSMSMNDDSSKIFQQTRSEQQSSKWLL